MNKPIGISIITVCYNAEKTIEQTIKSVLEQDYPNIEHIIIDGKSKDKTLDIINEQKSKIHVIKSEADNGIYDAMNKGLQLCNMEYCMFLNADDTLSTPVSISKCMALLQDSRTDALGATVSIYKKEKLYRTYSSHTFKRWMFRFGHQPPHPGFICKTGLLKNLGGFNDQFKIAGDFDMILRCFHQDEFTWKTTKLRLVYMAAGGASDGGLKQKWEMNLEILKSLKNNGIRSNSILIWMKYLIKVFQLF